jgi:hypothetical protein
MDIVGHASAGVHKGYSQGEWNSVKSAINKLPDIYAAEQIATTSSGFDPKLKLTHIETEKQHIKKERP